MRLSVEHSAVSLFGSVPSGFGDLSSLVLWAGRVGVTVRRRECVTSGETTLGRDMFCLGGLILTWGVVEGVAEVWVAEGTVEERAVEGVAEMGVANEGVAEEGGAQVGAAEDIGNVGIFVPLPLPVCCGPTGKERPVSAGLL